MQVEVELPVVEFADTIVDPRAVVVVSRHALVAVLAVLAPQRHLNVTNTAELLFNEQNHVVILCTRIGLVGLLVAD